MTAPQKTWLDQQERGSLFWIKVILWIARKMGRVAGRLLLYPITAYFLLFSVKARNASRNYLARILDESVTWRHLFRHYHTFAATILDRVFFLTGELDRFEFNIEGAETIFEYLNKGQGVILLGAHFGSFEALRSFGMLARDLPVNILMYEQNSQKITSVLNALNPKIATSIINIGAPDALIKVKEKIEAGEFVGILGDRITHGDKTAPVTFLGDTAHLPWGPLLLASVTKAPVVLFFGAYRGGARYDIYFEPLAEQLNISRANRKQEMTLLLQKYADALERRCRAEPYNWFNFYDYWAYDEKEDTNEK
jgi:predicted LPLAT superfamily acyltransferase